MYLPETEFTIRRYSIKELHEEVRRLLNAPPRHRGGVLTPSEVQLNIRRIEAEIERRLA